MESHITRRFRAPLLAGALLTLSTGCVTQVRYDEALEQVAYYQRALQDLARFELRREADERRLLAVTRSEMQADRQALGRPMERQRGRRLARGIGEVGVR